MNKISFPGHYHVTYSRLRTSSTEGLPLSAQDRLQRRSSTIVTRVVEINWFADNFRLTEITDKYRLARYIYGNIVGQLFMGTLVPLGVAVGLLYVARFGFLL